jgi:hypothetical protein
MGGEAGDPAAPSLRSNADAPPAGIDLAASISQIRRSPSRHLLLSSDQLEDVTAAEMQPPGLPDVDILLLPLLRRAGAREPVADVETIQVLLRSQFSYSERNCRGMFAGLRYEDEICLFAIKVHLQVCGATNLRPVAMRAPQQHQILKLEGRNPSWR